MKKCSMYAGVQCTQVFNLAGSTVYINDFFIMKYRILLAPLDVCNAILFELSFVYAACSRVGSVINVSCVQLLVLSLTLSFKWEGLGFLITERHPYHLLQSTLLFFKIKILKTPLPTIQLSKDFSSTDTVHIRKQRRWRIGSKSI